MALAPLAAPIVEVHLSRAKLLDHAIGNSRRRLWLRGVDHTNAGELIGVLDGQGSQEESIE